MFTLGHSSSVQMACRLVCRPVIIIILSPDRATKFWAIVVHMYRAWQKKLHASARDDSHKTEIHKYLWILMTERDPAIFQNNIQTFQTFWGKKNQSSFPTSKTTMLTELASTRKLIYTNSY